MEHDRDGGVDPVDRNSTGDVDSDHGGESPRPVGGFFVTGRGFVVGRSGHDEMRAETEG